MRSNFLSQIAVLILTFNEEDNIGRTLNKLQWAKKIIVIDSFSTDKTLEIIKKYPNAEVLQRKFDNFASQANWGLDRICTDWVLSIDADYVLSDELIGELLRLDLTAAPDGYFASFIYCLSGKPLRSTLLPPREVFFRKKRGSYVQDGHAHKLVNSGKSEYLKSFIYHDDRKSFRRWLSAQQKYSEQEADKLMRTSFKDLNIQDKLRRIILFAPTVVFFYCLLWRGLVLDGVSGVLYSAQRFIAEFLLSIKLARAFSAEGIKWIKNMGKN